MNLEEALHELETKWGKNVGFYGIPPCKDFPNGGYEINLIPKQGDTYIWGVFTKKQYPKGETLAEALLNALALIDSFEQRKGEK